MRKLFCGLSALMAAIGGGCGSVSDGTNHPAPMLVEGGAIAGGHISGYMNVYVTDGDSNAVLAGATVQVGSCSVTTDPTGLATFDPTGCPSLNGPVTLTASAGGYAPSTAIGVNGANVTMTLQAFTRPAPATAQVSGTIAGWEDLPAPGSGHTTIAYVAASQTDDLGDLANNIAQGTRDIQIGGTALTTTIAANSCARNALVDDCNWQLATRTGAQAHFAIVLDSYDNGTPSDSSDDVTTLVGWALLQGLSLSAGQTVMNEALPMMAAGDMQTITASLPGHRAAERAGTNPGGLPDPDHGRHHQLDPQGRGRVVRSARDGAGDQVRRRAVVDGLGARLLALVDRHRVGLDDGADRHHRERRDHLVRARDRSDRPQRGVHGLRRQAALVGHDLRRHDLVHAAGGHPQPAGAGHRHGDAERLGPHDPRRRPDQRSVQAGHPEAHRDLVRPDQRHVLIGRSPELSVSLDGYRKKDLVAGLVERYVDPDSPRALGALRLGSCSFQSYEPAEVLDAAQAAELLQVDEETIVQLAESGKLPGRKLGKSWRFSRAGLVAWLSTDRDVMMYVNSPGGEVSAGLAIYDTMQAIRCDVATFCLGQAASMASLLLAAGAPGKRSALPHARVMIHQPLAGMQGQATQIEIRARHVMRTRDTINALYTRHTGQEPERIERDTERDNFMSAAEAQAYDLVDQVLQRRPGAP